MPKITYSYARQPAVPEDVLLDLINRYQRARRVNSDEMAKALYLSSGTVYRQKKAKGLDRFSLEDFKACCRKLQIPQEDIAEAMSRYIRGK